MGKSAESGASHRVTERLAFPLGEGGAVLCLGTAP